MKEIEDKVSGEMNSERVASESSYFSNGSDDK